MIRELRKRWWLTTRMRREFPDDGWRSAWHAAGLIRQIARQPLVGRELTEAELFELEVEMDLAALPVLGEVA